MRSTSGSEAAVAGILLSCVVLAAYAFAQRISYELAGPYTWDTPIYWAVGRGILNGVMPWSGLFETKPPGIFLLSALSLKLTGDFSFTHIAQAAALVMIAVFPPLLLIGRMHDRPQLRVERAWMCLLMSLLGLLLAQYVAERSGEVQVESFGASFAALAVFVMASPLFATRPWAAALIGAVGWLGACGMKEPFIFPLLGAAMILLRTGQDWLTRCIYPLLVAILLGTGFLFLSGWWHDYLHIYLGHMSLHANRFGSPWQRASELWHLWEDMNAFARGLGYAMWGVVVGAFALVFLRARTSADAVAEAMRWMFALLAAALAVGLGGEYFNHHHIFAMPVVCAAIAVFVPVMMTQGHGYTPRLVWLVTLVCSCLAAIALPSLDLDARLGRLDADKQLAMREARYVDEVLDAAKLDQYLFVGGNGPQLYAFTRHSPAGPLFFQLQDLIDKSEDLHSAYLDKLGNAQLIVMEGTIPSLDLVTRNSLDHEFTTQPWPEVAHIKRLADKYTVWFRKRAVEADIAAVAQAARKVSKRPTRRRASRKLQPHVPTAQPAPAL